MLHTLLSLTLSGSILAVLLFLLRLALRRQLSSTVYYYAWLFVLLRFLLPFPGLIPLGEPAEAEVSAPAPYSLSSPPVPYGSYGVSYGYSSPERAGISEADDEPSAPAPSSSPLSLGKFWKEPLFWTYVWAGGASLSFILYVYSYCRFAGQVRRDLTAPPEEALSVYRSFSFRKPELSCCPAVNTPMLIGLLHPRILLPCREADAEMYRNILRHELTHYRRRDTLYKWFAVLVYSLQWFNPFVYLIRFEINRSCELSCDEMLLRKMSREEKQSYGNTLLSMAAGAYLPAGVVATSFATEKKNLKERIVQIMNYKFSLSRILASVLAFVLFAGCAVFAGPKSSAENSPAPDTPSTEITVSTVDEFLAAIAPNTTIYLKEGVYDLSQASGYGNPVGGSWYYWNDAYDGKELVISDVSNLTIKGAGKDSVTIAAIPRYANVIFFDRCSDIRLEGFTAGHTEEPGACAGGVLYFRGCSRVGIDGCGMYGCGIIGISAESSFDISVTNSEIYDCSWGAVFVAQCRNVSLDRCVIRDHGTYPGAVSYLFYADSTDSFRVTNSEIRNNTAQTLLITGYSRNIVFTGNRVENNSFLSSLFSSQKYSPVVDGCSFSDNGIVTWIEGSVFPVDTKGVRLGKEDLESMVLEENMDLSSLAPAEGASSGIGTMVASEDGMYHVATMDEFLAALGPDRTIVLDAEVYDLTTASDYGTPGGEYYYWSEAYDGPELIISGANNLTIMSNPADPGAHSIVTLPRYANVLSFYNCTGISLIGFTAGHIEQAGTCSGGVLHFQNCSGIYMEKCNMFGCGTLGIDASNSVDFDIVDCSIYDCSQGGVYMYLCDGIRFTSCSIYDVDGPMLTFYESGDKTWDGTPIDGYGCFNIAEDGSVIGYNYEDNNEEPESVIDSKAALMIARSELKRLQALGILSPDVVFDGELEYCEEAAEGSHEGRNMTHGFYAYDYSGKYFLNFRIDDTDSGDIRFASIEAAADADDEVIGEAHFEGIDDPLYYYDNFDDIFPTDLTIGELCEKLCLYWGYSGYTLADSYDEFYQMQMDAPAPDTLLTDLPENNYYVTAYFDGDQENAPMFVQITHFPGSVCFLFGEQHLVG